MHQLRGMNLLAKDLCGKSDPYAILQVNRERQWSKVIKRELNPKWDEKFLFPIWHLALEKLYVQLWDWDQLVKLFQFSA